MEEKQVGNSKRSLYIVGLSFLSINAILQIYQSLVPLIMQRDFKVSEWKIGMITGAVNVVVCVLLLGLNKIRRTVGKLVFFATILSVALMLTPQSIKHRNVVLFVILVYVGMMALSYIKVMANDFTLRVALPGKENSAMALTKIMSTIGAIIVFIIMYALNNDCMFYAMVLLNVLTVGGIFCIRKHLYRSMDNNGATDSKKSKKALRGRYVKSLVVILLCYTVYDAMLSTFSRYATIVWNMEDNEFALYQSICLITAFIAYIPIGKVSNGRNQKKITLGGIGVMIASLVTLGALSGFHFIAIICLGLIGVAWAAISVNLVPILVYGANEQETSSLVGYYSVMNNIGLIIAPIIAGFLLEYFSYRMLYPWLSGILAVAAIILLFVKCEKNEDE